MTSSPSFTNSTSMSTTLPSVTIDTFTSLSTSNMTITTAENIETSTLPTSTSILNTTAETAKAVVILEMTIIKNWNNEYSNQKSEAYQTLEREILNWTDNAFSSTSGYIGSQIISLRPGSIKAEIESIFESSKLTASEVNSTVERAVQEGFSLGNLSVSASV